MRRSTNILNLYFAYLRNDCYKSSVDGGISRKNGRYIASFA